MMTKKAFEQLAADYFSHKTSMDGLKKVCSDENTKIKSYMSEKKIDKFDSDDFTISYSEKQRNSMNEDKLLEICKQAGLTNVIRTKEYVDEDLLENALYHGDISDDIKLKIAECNTVSIIPEIRIKAKKKG